MITNLLFLNKHVKVPNFFKGKPTDGISRVPLPKGETSNSRSYSKIKKKIEKHIDKH